VEEIVSSMTIGLIVFACVFGGVLPWPVTGRRRGMPAIYCAIL
jgi:hypothetical protein